MLDLEVAFSRLNDDGKLVADRIDMAEVVYDVNDVPVLRLVEVKASDDARLRARGNDDAKLDEKNKIMHQMNIYREFIKNEGVEIQKSYRNVAKNMLSLGFDKYLAGSGGKSSSEILKDFAERGIVDQMPHLLVLYVQENNYVIDAHFQRLKRVIAEKYPPLRLVNVCQS